jgi:hypothetical protein
MNASAGTSRGNAIVVALVAGGVSLLLGFVIAATIWADDDSSDDSSPPASAEASDIDDSGPDAASSDPADDSFDPPGAPVENAGDTPETVTSDAQPGVVSSQSGGNTERTYNWHWEYQGKVLLLNAFSCPSEAPYVKSNGTYRGTQKHPEVKAWHVADMTATASDGVGYHEFSDGSASVQQDGTQFLTGWKEGSVLANSIWFPVFKSGTFDLTVTCTSSTSRDDVAWAGSGYGIGGAFPWGYH